MAQLSRPYQVVLILVAVLALAWFAVLRSHVSTSSGGSSSAGSAPSQASAAAPKAGAIERHESTPTRVYHGPAPGVEGLTKGIKRAHEAVGTSEVQAHKLESATGAQSGSSGASQGSQAASRAHSAAAAGSRAVTRTHSSSSTHSSSATAHHPAASTPSRAPKGGDASRALTVERQLRQGKVVLLLFWNPRSFDDQAVHSQVQAASGALKGKVAADYAKPGEVSAFGTVTRDVSVLQTPTLLLINRKGLTTTITGLTDAFSIEQAVREAGG